VLHSRFKGHIIKLLFDCGPHKEDRFIGLFHDAVTTAKDIQRRQKTQ